MRAPISIVIPTLDAAGTLPAALSALIEGLAAGLVREVIVSDGGSRDATCDIARAAGADVVEGSRGRGAQLRRGAEAARGDWVLLLHADTELGEGWSRAASDFVKDPAWAGYFDLAFRASGAAPRVVAGWANLRSRAFGLPYGDQGLLVPRALLEAAGGVPDLPLMEDVALARRLRGRLRPIGVVARTSADRYLREGWVRRSVLNGWQLARYLAGADPARLARAYERAD